MRDDPAPSDAPSDAPVLFGVTGDLAYKQIFPALYAMWRIEQLRARARESVEHAAAAGATDAAADPGALERLLALLHYVSGDYNDAAIFAALKCALDGAGAAARHPLHYLAIPPALFTTVIHGLNGSGLAAGARVIVEKPFGRDLASARALNRVALEAFDAEAIFRIDHFLGKEEVLAEANTLARSKWV